jgi:hypothetical protein
LVPSASPSESIENELKTLWRLRHKHPAKSPEARSYRHAILDKARRLRAFRLARQANTDLMLPPIRKKVIPSTGRSFPPIDEPSVS